MQIWYSTIKKPSKQQSAPDGYFTIVGKTETNAISGQETQTRDRWIVSPPRWSFGHAALVQNVRVT